MQLTFATVTTAVLALSSAATANPSTTHHHTDLTSSTSVSTLYTSPLPLMPSAFGNVPEYLPIQTGSVPIVWVPGINATNATDVKNKTLVERPILPRDPVPIDVKKKLRETPGAAWAITCFDACNKGVPCLIKCTTDYEVEGKGNKPDDATVDKAYEALPRILSLLDCVKSSGANPGK